MDTKSHIKVILAAETLDINKSVRTLLSKFYEASMSACRHQTHSSRADVICSTVEFSATLCSPSSQQFNLAYILANWISSVDIQWN